MTKDEQPGEDGQQARKPRIAIVNYGMGNLRSAQKALERVGAEVEVTDDHEHVRAADGIVLPGVGAFPRAIEAIERLGLGALIVERAHAGTPTLGICLGMQLLFEGSTELGGAAGLGLIAGRVEALEADGLKLPQIGWNTVSWRRGSALTDGLPDPCAFYHVHSYAAIPADSEDTLGTATYGPDFVSAIEHGPLYGVQFHPEKSGEHGLRLLTNFAEICSPSLAGSAPDRRSRGSLRRAA